MFKELSATPEIYNSQDGWEEICFKYSTVNPVQVSKSSGSSIRFNNIAMITFNLLQYWYGVKLDWKWDYYREKLHTKAANSEITIGISDRIEQNECWYWRKKWSIKQF